MVKISTGPLSSGAADGIVPLETAIALLKDMGGSSIKYFPMGGLKHRAEFEAVAKACAAHDFWLEPTGGIDLEKLQRDPENRPRCRGKQNHPAYLQLDYR